MASDQARAAQIVLGTAGHVDHGKTALVFALTGRETDRLPAEKERGISIELGFAELTLPGGRMMSLIDVPGHERFVRHMVAGASGIDGYLLCVAADDGVMPQTREHMAVLRLLGVADGIVVVTKCDLAEPTRAADEARALVGDEAVIVAVSARTGVGIADLEAALLDLAGRVPRRTAAGPSRLFVDRVFSVPGAGTVVTGTLWGDMLKTDEHVTIHPSGATARIRGVQSHDRVVDVASGGRVALNLARADREQAGRGSCVVRTSDAWTPSRFLDVELKMLPDASGPLRTRRRVQAFLGTVECAATTVLLHGDELAPGAVGFAQLRLDVPVTALAGDRVVLRSAERVTFAGATVVDANAPRHGRGPDVVARLRAIAADDVADRAGALLDDAGPLGVPAATLRGAPGVELPGGWMLSERWFAAACARLDALLADGRDVALATAVATMGLGREATEGVLAIREADGAFVRRGASLVPPRAGSVTPDSRVAGELAVGGLRGRTVAQLAEALALTPEALEADLGELRARGDAVRIDEIWFAAPTIDRAVARAVASLAESPRTLAELRDVWGVGRRHALVLAAHLDAVGVTRREDEKRTLRRGAAERFRDTMGPAL